VFLKLTFNFLKSWSTLMAALPFIFTLLLVDMFDNIGTLIGVSKRAGLLDADGVLPKAGRALMADSIATMLSALCGTSTVVSYIESASGVEAGGRTGLTAIWVAIFMLLALFLTPLILADPPLRDGAGARHRRHLHDAVGG
jgi:AGZA family xanthine/uracil permease-like MFS transporter